MGQRRSRAEDDLDDGLENQQLAQDTNAIIERADDVRAKLQQTIDDLRETLAAAEGIAARFNKRRRK